MGPGTPAHPRYRLARKGLGRLGTTAGAGAAVFGAVPWHFFVTSRRFPTTHFHRFSALCRGTFLPHLGAFPWRFPPLLPSRSPRQFPVSPAWQPGSCGSRLPPHSQISHRSWLSLQIALPGSQISKLCTLYKAHRTIRRTSRFGPKF